MKKCSKECIVVCDYCRFYNFNGRIIDGEEVYVDEGYCVLKEKHYDSQHKGCWMFICNSYKKIEGFISDVSCEHNIKWEANFTPPTEKYIE